MEVGLPQSELAELGWLAHFPVPISNEENKQLELEVTNTTLKIITLFKFCRISRANRNFDFLEIFQNQGNFHC